MKGIYEGVKDHWGFVCRSLDDGTVVLNTVLFLFILVFPF